MTTERNIIIHAGQAFTLSLDYAGTVGRGQRMHIRAADAASTVIAILTHNGDANARVIYDGSDSIDVTIGASVSGEWLVGANRVEWVYDIEDYDLSDADDVVITHRGKVIVYGNRTRPAEIDPAPTPNSNAPFVRWDMEQSLTDEEKERARDNIGAGTGGGGGSVEWGDVTGTLSDQTDLNNALAAKAPLASPTFTGTPAAPTAAGGTSTTQIATTAFVGSAVSTHAGAADPHGDRAYTDTQIAGRQAASATLTTLSSATAAGLALMDDATAADQRTTLGLGTAATHNVAASGNAASGEVVKGNDTRLDVAATVHAATAASLADADEQGFWQSASSALRKITWANVKAAIKAYADTLYAAITHNHAASAIDSGTLDAARLPAPTTTALGGVKRNTGSAGQYVTGIDTDGSLLRDTPAGGASNTKWIGAGELIPRVTNGSGIDGEELATNDINLDYLAFDASTAEYAQVAFAWLGAYTTCTATFYWTAASGSGGVRWSASARCYADDDALDQAQGTAQAVSDTLTAANDHDKSAATSAITPAGTVAAGNFCVVEVSRQPSHGDDTLAVDARLIGVLLEFA